MSFSATHPFTNINLSDVSIWEVHSICAVVKSYIRNLEEPVYTSACYENLITLSQEKDDSKRIFGYRKLHETLDDAHRATLVYIMNHLRRVADHAIENKMQIKNIAIVFGPTLISPGGESTMASLGDMKHQCKIVEDLVRFHGEIFPRQEVTTNGNGGNEMSLNSESKTNSTPTASMYSTDTDSDDLHFGLASLNAVSVDDPVVQPSV